VTPAAEPEAPAVRPEPPQHSSASRRGAVTSADVARAAGVSRGAVSQILGGRGQRFAPDTVARVLEAARRLEYEPSSAARTLARGTSDVVVAVLPRTTFGSNQQDIIDVLTTELAAHGLLLVLHYATEDVTALDRLVAALRPAAVLPFAEPTSVQVEVLRRRGAPLALSGAAPPDGELDGNQLIGAIQARHLAERGHRTLAYAHLKDRRNNTYGPDRLAGFRAACATLGLSEPAVIDVPIDADEATRQLDRLSAPVAVACYNDEVALTLLACAARLAWRTPADVALVGVDHTPLGQAMTPRLTSVAYDPAQIGRRLAQTALATAGRAGNASPSRPSFELIPGETT
jgi:DNA-binding LacI/PurR family transcriptional regulator